MQREEDQTVGFGFYSKYRGVDSVFKDGSMTSSDINFKIILQLLCRNGVEGRDRNWVHRGAAYFGGVCTLPSLCRLLPSHVVGTLPSLGSLYALPPAAVRVGALPCHGHSWAGGTLPHLWAQCRPFLICEQSSP